MKAEPSVVHRAQRRRWLTRFAVDVARYRRSNVVELHEGLEAYIMYGHLHPSTAAIEWLSRFYHSRHVR